MIYKFLSRIVLVLLISFSTIAQTVIVKIIETSDVHGAIFPYDLKENKEINSSLARVTTYLKEQRADTNQIVFLLDNGIFFRAILFIYYNLKRQIQFIFMPM
jgi:2',3'-cyclic-nucleotide 2'-phosphodiesterase/3'-nucleotidase